MARYKVKLNLRGLNEVMKSPEMQAALRGEVEPMLSEAQRRAPVDTGAYKASLHIETEVTRFVAVARVVASDEKAMLVEAQTGNLARAVNGKRAIRRRERAQQRREEKKYNEQVKREEDAGGF